MTCTPDMPSMRDSTSSTSATTSIPYWAAESRKSSATSRAISAGSTWHFQFYFRDPWAGSAGFNLTDGLDGLAIGPVIIAAVTYMFFSYAAGHARIAEYLQITPVSGCGEITVYCGALAGAGLGFLWFNAYPAQVFMGDTGSLAIGGIIAVFAILIRKELLIPILCGIFW